MPRRTEQITLSLQPGDREKIEAIADKLGCVWGMRPSISALLADIARGKLKVTKND